MPISRYSITATTALLMDKCLRVLKLTLRKWIHLAQHLEELGYNYKDETDNQAYRFFLAQQVIEVS